MKSEGNTKIVPVKSDVAVSYGTWGGSAPVAIQFQGGGPNLSLSLSMHMFIYCSSY